MPGPPIPVSAWLLRIVGTLFFAGLLVWLDLTGRLQVEEILAALRGANLALVALSIALYVPFLAVKASRWRMISADMRMPMGRLGAWRMYAIGLAAGTFTPGQAKAFDRILGRYTYRGRRLLRSGKDYSGRKDDMHLEIIAERADVLAAVKLLQEPPKPAPKPAPVKPGEYAPGTTTA
jgi:hypothetical protein